MLVLWYTLSNNWNASLISRIKSMDMFLLSKFLRSRCSCSDRIGSSCIGSSSSSWFQECQYKCKFKLNYSMSQLGLPLFCSKAVKTYQWWSMN